MDEEVRVDSNDHHSKDMSIACEYGENIIVPRTMNIESLDISQRGPDITKMEPCDVRELTNPQYVSQYAVEIFEYLRAIEVQFS
jgi:hypothetical protein